MSVEVEELGENDHRRGDSIRRHQNSETSQKGETKKTFHCQHPGIANRFSDFPEQKKVEYLLNRRLRIQTRNGPNGSGRRRWPTAGVNLGDGWNKKATKKGHGRHTLMPEAHSNVASLSVALNAKKMLWLTALTLYPGGLRTRNCTGSAGGRGPASGLELVRILLKRWLHRRFDALSQCGEM